MKDLYSNHKITIVKAPYSGAGDDVASVGAIIDNQGYESLMYLILLGSLADANATFAVLLEEGDDSGLSDAATVADVDNDPVAAIISFDFADDDSVRRLGYTGNKRYTRLTLTPTGNTGAWLHGVVAVQGHAHAQPQTAQAT